MTLGSAWYYLQQSERCGPIDSATLDRLAAQGVVQPETPVWAAGMEDWQSYASLQRAPSPGHSCRDCRAQSSVLHRLGTIWVCDPCLAVRLEKTASAGHDAEKARAVRSKAAMKLVGGLLGLAGLVAMIGTWRDAGKGLSLSLALIGLAPILAGLSGTAELLSGKSNIALIARWDAIRKWQQVLLGWAIFGFAMLLIFGGVVVAVNLINSR